VHTNPILICFCSILYYQDLAEHIRRYRMEKKIIKAIEKNNLNEEIHYSLKKFSGKLLNEPEKSDEGPILKKKIYKQLVLNRWHVLLRLTLNKELIVYRRHNIRKKTKIYPISIFARVKLFFMRKKGIK